MLTKKEVLQIREELDTCNNPLFIFDDDADGFCSYLLMYRYKKEGHGVIVKSAPMVDKKFLRKVREYNPDKIFILDMPMVNQDFLEEVKVPVIWIDHHGVQNPKKAKYFNPRKNKSDSYQPTTTMSYLVTQQDIWIGMIGSVADWHLPSFREKFNEQYPGYLDPAVDRPDVALFDSKLGELIRIISYNLKGDMKEVRKFMKAMVDIKTPDEIFAGETKAAKVVMKRFGKLNEDYQRIYGDAMKVMEEADHVGVFMYNASDTSFTSDLSTELSYRFPKKIVVVCREKDGEMKCSLRSREIKLPELINKCLDGLDGHGGGHEYACGLVTKKEHFQTFMERFTEHVSRS